jgi:hypothetical protein
VGSGWNRHNIEFSGELGNSCVQTYASTVLHLQGRECIIVSRWHNRYVDILELQDSIFAIHRWIIRTEISFPKSSDEGGPGERSQYGDWLRAVCPRVHSSNSTLCRPVLGLTQPPV